MAENQVKHLGVIMDGNRRWARQHMFSSVMRGHEKGVDTFIDLCEWCENAGIPYLTVYAFSTENWKRSQEEVRDLFKLMRRFFTDEIHRCVEKGVKVKVIGNLAPLSEEDRAVIRDAEDVTRDCGRLYLQIALSYGGRDEILRAAEQYAADLAAGRLAENALTEELFDSYLYTRGVPDMDLVIRTGGEQRLSNFFPWQTTYADLWFTDVLWPDFSEDLLGEALRWYRNIKINKGR
ncbi:MAG: di-trans,poly-cis-decaprenylcistransferase [Lachnospiraceae bacterium]|nr:di-trans,poly-cis-decaprenylcistransferase [Lachnospiraceae bacterium]